MIKQPFWEELNQLSKKQLLKLADIMGVGINNPVEGPPLDKEELVLILSTESPKNIKEGLKKLSS